ncbi:MAG: HvfC/BufC family peptide modification chaperone, partial [Gammaproteobacteria bacterium]
MSTYPVVSAIVGEEFFEYAARQYVRKHPSLSGDLNDYGDRFPRYISSLPQTRHLPYLEDVARLEWAMQEVARASEPPAFNSRGLKQVPPARYPELRFALHPASRILHSPYPVLAIWSMHQDATSGVVNLDAGGVRLLIIRRHLEIELEPLSRGEYEMLTALAAADPFGSAAESALAVDPDFEITVSIRDHVARRTIVDFYF